METGTGLDNVGTATVTNVTFDANTTCTPFCRANMAGASPGTPGAAGSGTINGKPGGPGRGDAPLAWGGDALANHTGPDGATPVLTVTNTIAGPVDDGNSPNGTGSMCAVPTPLHDGGGNVVADSTCTVTGGGQDPGFAAGLADNGGPTKTVALLPTSPAVDAGVEAACSASPVSGLDQRGVTRPHGTSCDSGAYELQSAVTAPGTPAPPTASPTTPPGSAVAPPPSTNTPPDTSRPRNLEAAAGGAAPLASTGVAADRMLS